MSTSWICCIIHNNFNIIRYLNYYPMLNYFSDFGYLWPETLWKYFYGTLSVNHNSQSKSHIATKVTYLPIFSEILPWNRAKCISGLVLYPYIFTMTSYWIINKLILITLLISWEMWLGEFLLNEHDFPDSITEADVGATILCHWDILSSQRNWRIRFSDSEFKHENVQNVVVVKDWPSYLSVKLCADLMTWIE